MPIPDDQLPRGDRDDAPDPDHGSYPGDPHHADDACFALRRAARWLLVYVPQPSPSDPTPTSSLMARYDQHGDLLALIGHAQEHAVELVTERRFLELLAEHEQDEDEDEATP